MSQELLPRLGVDIAPPSTGTESTCWTCGDIGTPRFLKTERIPRINWTVSLTAGDHHTEADRGPLLRCEASVEMRCLTDEE